MDGVIKLITRLAFLGCLIGSAWISSLFVPTVVLMISMWWD